jgi:hypothetical protein
MKRIGAVSALIYTGVSLLAATVFLLLTLLRTYTGIERIGGTLWVFILSMIILMPLVTPIVKKKLNSR